MNKNTRIEFSDSGMDIILKLAEGNPGALRVCLELFAKGGKIDPDAWAGGLSCLLDLDSAGIYGSEIWMFYKDVCKENLVTMVAMQRAVQLGFLPQRDLTNAILGVKPLDDLKINEMVAAVRQRLPAFGQPEKQEAA